MNVPMKPLLGLFAVLALAPTLACAEASPPQQAGKAVQAFATALKGELVATRDGEYVPLWVDGIHGKALKFMASNYVKVPDFSDPIGPDGKIDRISMSYWINKTGHCGYGGNDYDFYDVAENTWISSPIVPDYPPRAWNHGINVAGVMVNAIASALISFSKTLVPPSRAQQLVRWLIGFIELPTTTALLASSVLRTHPGATILHNLICSRAVPEIVEASG